MVISDSGLLDRFEAIYDSRRDKEWIKTLEDGRKAKFSYQALPEDRAFLAAQRAGNEVSPREASRTMQLWDNAYQTIHTMTDDDRVRAALGINDADAIEPQPIANVYLAIMHAEPWSNDLSRLLYAFSGYAGTAHIGLPQVTGLTIMQECYAGIDRTTKLSKGEALPPQALSPKAHATTASGSP
jgi:hypothetical protein